MDWTRLILFLPWHWNVQRFHMPCHAYGLFIFKSAEFLCLCIFLCLQCIWQILLSLLSPWFSFAIWKSLSLWNSWLQESLVGESLRQKAWALKIKRAAERAAELSERWWTHRRKSSGLLCGLKSDQVQSARYRAKLFLIMGNVREDQHSSVITSVSQLSVTSSVSGQEMNSIMCGAALGASCKAWLVCQLVPAVCDWRDIKRIWIGVDSWILIGYCDNSWCVLVCFSDILVTFGIYWHFGVQLVWPFTAWRRGGLLFGSGALGATPKRRIRSAEKKKKKKLLSIYKSNIVKYNIEK